MKETKVTKSGTRRIKSSRVRRDEKVGRGINLIMLNIT
jgi:hypothetical protein